MHSTRIGARGSAVAPANGGCGARRVSIARASASGCRSRRPKAVAQVQHVLARIVDLMCTHLPG